jgi:lysozyme family protein
MYEALKAKNLKRWQASKVTKYYPSIVKKILANKVKYQQVEALTGVPWVVIACIHVREADMNFNTQLAQGDPLSRKSIHVPKGQGPYTGPNAWVNAAVRALKDAGGPSWKDWTPGGWTTFLEKYNGLGYSSKGRSSPYVWAGTNQYSSGKYIADGQYSSSVVDTQPGCASLIGQLAVEDKTINPDDLSKKSNVIAHTTAGTIVAGGATTVALAPHHLWTWIAVGACVITALSIWAYIYFKGNK